MDRPKPDEQFLYEFDFGDSRLHLCTVGLRRVDAEETLDIVPPHPVPYWDWCSLPNR